MGTLVNPIGWRLRSNIYWKINFVALDQNNFMQNSNNYLAYYKIIEGVLNRLNKMFNASNYIRFSGHKIFVQQTTAFLLVRMRISRDTEIRRKAGRSFKYLRKEVASENKIKFSFSGWVLRTRWFLKNSRKKLKHMRRELNFIEKNQYLIKDKKEATKLRKVLNEKFLDWYKLRKKRDLLRHRLVFFAQRRSRKYKKTRAMRVTKFLKAVNKPLYNKRTIERKDRVSSKYGVVFWYPHRRRERARIKERSFGNYYSRSGTSKVYASPYKRRRWRKFLTYHRVRKIKKRIRRFLQKKTLQSHFSPNTSVGLYTRKPTLNLKLRKTPRARVIRSAFRIKKKKGRRRKIKPRVLPLLKKRRKIKKRLKKKAIMKARQYAKLYAHRRWWDRPKRNRLTWRRLSFSKRISYRNFAKRRLLIFFFFIPFLVEVKRFLGELFVKASNLQQIRVYFLGEMKPKVVEAKYILEFIERFLKKRRRVTKINKLFYRLMKILRFLKAKYKFRGFKLLLAGRFLRRDRATYIWKTRGAVPLSTKLSKIDFAARPMQMKYSRPIAKLWICRK